MDVHTAAWNMRALSAMDVTRATKWGLQRLRPLHVSSWRLSEHGPSFLFEIFIETSHFVPDAFVKQIAHEQGKAAIYAPPPSVAPLRGGADIIRFQSKTRKRGRTCLYFAGARHLRSLSSPLPSRPCHCWQNNTWRRMVPTTSRSGQEHERNRALGAVQPRARRRSTGQRLRLRFAAQECRDADRLLVF